MLGIILTPPLSFDRGRRADDTQLRADMEAGSNRARADNTVGEVVEDVFVKGVGIEAADVFVLVLQGSEGGDGEVALGLGELDVFSGLGDGGLEIVGGHRHEDGVVVGVGEVCSGEVCSGEVTGAVEVMSYWWSKGHWSVSRPNRAPNLMSVKARIGPSVRSARGMAQSTVPSGHTGGPSPD